MRRRVHVRLLLGLIVVAGCNRVPDPPQIRTVPVSGRVTVNGKPITTGRVWFSPDSSKGNASQHHARGVIDEEGNFTLTTEDHEGAPPGWYKVAVSATVAAEDPAKAGQWVPPKSLINEKYSLPVSSGLAVEVVDSPKPGAYDLKLLP